MNEPDLEQPDIDGRWWHDLEQSERWHRHIEEVMKLREYLNEEKRRWR